MRKVSVAAVGAALLLSCLPPALCRAEDTAEKAFRESRQRFDQKTHIKIDYQVILSSGMTKALKRYNPAFQAWRSEDYLPSLIQLYEFKSSQRKDYFAYQTPSAVIGDFNGDNTPDAAITGHDKINNLTVAIMSGKSDYRIIEMGKGPLINPKEEWYGMYGGAEGREYGLSSYLTLFQSGKIKANPGLKRPEIDLKTDAILLEVFEKASVLHIYNQDKFVSYTMGD